MRIFFTINLRRLSVKAILCVVFLSLSSSVAVGADDVKKVKRAVARLHLEMMQLKEKTSKLAGEQLALLEPQNEKIETLTRSNLKLSETITGSHGFLFFIFFNKYLFCRSSKLINFDNLKNNSSKLGTSSGIICN